jgi:polyisoprenoid-binding protein YceI
VQIKTQNTMKKIGLFTASIALIAFGMTACGGATEAAEEAVTYELDAKATELKWKGDYADGSHSHNGTVAVSEGTMSFKGETFEKGMFKVDMGTIKSELTPETGANDLLGHFSSPDFFNSAKFPTVDVTINNIEGNEMDATLKIGGKDLKTKIPVTIKKTADSYTVKGKFTVDFSALDLNGFKPNLEKEKESGKKDQYVNPEVGFELNLVMKAKK